MQAITNLWQEKLHDIFITTQRGRKLRLRIDHDAEGYTPAGEFYEIDDKTWYHVDFVKTRASHSSALLTTCLVDLHRALEHKSDTIVEIHNTTPTPVVSLEKQQEIVSRLRMPVQFRVDHA